MLQGDVADNIPGFVKLTGTRVSKWKPILDKLYAQPDEKHMWGYVSSLFIYEFFELDLEGAYDTEVITRAVFKTLTETGRLLWMQRDKDDMWEPPK